MLFERFGQRLWMATLFAGIFASIVSVACAEELPASLRGAWRIARILPTTNSGCWTREQAQSLVGTTLMYSQNEMRWRGGAVRLEDVYTRELDAAEFRNENEGPTEPASFAQLGVRAAALTEVDMQHEDAAVLPASTEIPGDSVLMVAPDRIVVSACGVYYEAARVGSRAKAVSTRRMPGIAARGSRDSGRLRPTED